MPGRSTPIQSRFPSPCRRQNSGLLLLIFCQTMKNHAPYSHQRPSAERKIDLRATALPSDRQQGVANVRLESVRCHRVAQHDRAVRRPRSADFFFAIQPRANDHVSGRVRSQHRTRPELSPVNQRKSSLGELLLRALARSYYAASRPSPGMRFAGDVRDGASQRGTFGGAIQRTSLAGGTEPSPISLLEKIAFFPAKNGPNRLEKADIFGMGSNLNYQARLGDDRTALGVFRNSPSRSKFYEKLRKGIAKMKSLPILEGGDLFPEICPACNAPRKFLANYACGAYYARLDTQIDGEPTDNPSWGGVCPVEQEGDTQPEEKSGGMSEHAVLAVIDSAIAMSAKIVVGKDKTKQIRLYELHEGLSNAFLAARWLVALSSVVMLCIGCSGPIPAGAITVTRPGGWSVTVAESQPAQPPQIPQGVPDQPVSGGR